MGDWEFPGSGETEASPQTSQTLLDQPPPTHDEEEQQKQLQLRQQQRQLKRSSLPARPHGAARHTKRLTLNFPINLPPTSSSTADSQVSSPGSMTPATRSSIHQSPIPSIGTPLGFDDQDDGSEILTAIASQERKVLELREELQRAEAELDSLKRQWAMSEKTKKRTEINHRAEPLLPLRSPTEASVPDKPADHSRERSVASSEDSSAVAQSRYSRELGRRQSMRASATKGTKISANGRRVFQGSHARTLSLLSPVSGANTPTVSVSETGGPVEGGGGGERIGRSPRSATLPSSVERSPMMTVGDMSEPTEDMISQWRKTMPPPSREMLMKTGRQMASDLREGLWTFLEDIRQATVGEEGINATESRTMPSAVARNRDSSSSHSRSRDRLSSMQQGGKLSRSSSAASKGAGTKISGKDSQSADIGSSFWSEFGIDAPGQTSREPLRQPASTPSGPTVPVDESNNSNNNTPSKHLDVDENWDNWDTPQPKKMHTPSSSRSTLESKHDQSPVTQTSSPRTSTSFGDWRQSHDSHVPDPSVSEGIPWPAITKLTPSKLTRTASNLMAEWERSLSPSPERKPTSPGLDNKDAKSN
ncbi:hypothetical protein FE257_011148 [Aspergillus nanangensis]|uniref:DUF4048 domain-containing protein n=1 Tax=Aspergillus nanangensis TaxID=2582783 RepID=A0AAD4CHV8_ASPNN|nr:hypothetical protein FE257_011148 [Aspergillus nanangensis]